jgi:hypothetical protein
MALTSEDMNEDIELPKNFFDQEVVPFEGGEHLDNSDCLTIEKFDALFA